MPNGLLTLTPTALDKFFQLLWLQNAPVGTPIADYTPYAVGPDGFGFGVNLVGGWTVAFDPVNNVIVLTAPSGGGGGGGLTPVYYNNASSPPGAPLVLAVSTIASADVSTGPVRLQFPASPANGALVGIANDGGDASVTPVSFISNGNAYEDPYNPGSFVTTPLAIHTKGMSATWQFLSWSNEWKLR